MKRKTIDASREVRLWISQILIPGAVGGLMLWSNPNVRCFVKQKVEFFKSKFQKE